MTETADLQPEQLARREIDRQLEAAGWAIQNKDRVNLAAGRGVAIREVQLKSGHGFVDYLLYVDRRAAGLVEAKPAGTTLTGVEIQGDRYTRGLPDGLPAHIRPLPFMYLSTGSETTFTNLLDPEPRSRRLFTFHRPETLAAWLAAEPLWMPIVEGKPHHASQRPATLRSRLRTMPPVPEKGLWPAQLKAVRNLEQSLAQDQPRSLIQMTTGSGKTYVAVTTAYRLIKFADARRTLFLVDRATLGRQALREFQAYTTPDDGRKFSELYNVQHLTSNKVDPVARVCISTIQRLYSMLKGDELDETLDETSVSDLEKIYSEPVPVAYNPRCPPEYFDVIFVDECHRSIYTVWRQVLEYFDAFLIGITATPSKQTFGFFNQNLVTEYGHAQAVADGVNVDQDVYRIRTRISEQGSKVEAGFWVDRRDRESRRVRWEKLDTDLQYAPSQLDRDVVAVDQIRTVLQTFKERLFTEIFPGRKDVPKTLVFAKDDSHADDIVRVAREVFGKGNEFAQKITYKTTGAKPEDLIAAFRTAYNPRIAVTVDMIATGTDIRPLEVVLFLRDVKSRVYFEQMKGRGARVIGSADFQSVTPDARAKERFVIVDCVGVTEREDWKDAPSLDREPTIPLDKLFSAIALGNADPDVASSIASRLARLDRRLTDEERKTVRARAGRSLTEITGKLVAALDPDLHVAQARRTYGLSDSTEPTEVQMATAAESVVRAALEPLATDAELRQLLLEIKRSKEQTIDAVSKDSVLDAGYSAAAKDRAGKLVKSFEQFIEDNKDQITALQIIYNRPRGKVLTYQAARELAQAIAAPPRQWTTEKLWKAYETVNSSKVRGAPERILTNLVRLVRYAVHQQDELVPHPEVAGKMFDRWLAAQEDRGRHFSAEERQWLLAIRDHVAANLEVTSEDLDMAPFRQMGGPGRAQKLFGENLAPLLGEVMEILAA